MSDSREASSIIGILLVVIIIGAGLYIGFMTLAGTGDITTTDTSTTSTTTGTTTPTTSTTGSTTTTTTGSTTTTSTTTTTTTTVEPITLSVLTRYDVAIHNVFEPAFLASEFALENNIVDIVWRTPSEAFWDDLIDLGQIDVCWGGGPAQFDQLMLDNLLAPLTSPLMLDVASRVNDTVASSDMIRNNTDGDIIWIATSISSFGIVVNHDFLTTHSLPVPRNWTDLANITYASFLTAVPAIAMANAPDSVTVKMIYHIILQALGWDEGWISITRMAGSANIYSGVIEALVAVQNGDVGIGLMFDYYGLWAENTNPDCEYIIPQDGALIQGEPIAIANTSTQKDLAEGFIDFVLSPAGQALLLDESIHKLPVMREAFDEPGLTGIEDLYSVFNQTTRLTSLSFDESLASEVDASVSNYFEATLTDAHIELAGCWEAISDAFTGGWGQCCKNTVCFHTGCG
jgi:ABC-type Fe3+ transport system substrate-binding protein